MRTDFAEGKVVPSITTYARKLHRQHKLNPPSVETIKNFISKLRAAQRADDASF